MADTRPGTALAAWARAVVAHAAVHRGLAALIAAGLDEETSELHTACARMNDIGEQLVRRAQESGTSRPTATGAGVFTLISAAARTREHLSPAQADRLLDLTLTGLGLEAGGDGQPS